MPTIISWNVNGMRAVLSKGFLDWLHGSQPDIVGLQETRVEAHELPDEARQPEGYYAFWNPAKKRGYAGTGLLTRIEPLSVETLGNKAYDDEGRLQVVTFPAFTVLNGYWPNSQAERARLPYKLSWCRAITRLANKLVREGRDVVLCGDMNIAHTEIDLARPKDNQNSAGFYIEEREAMTRFLKHGYVDTFRHYHPDEPGHYSWWSYRANARAKDIGWRIDYHLVNEALLPRVQRAWIEKEVMGSDHCPVGVEVA